MKRIITALLLIICIGTISGVDLESYQFIDRLLSLEGPSAPVIFEDAIIFTASSRYQRVGISFAHEGYSKVHWLKKLMTPKDVMGIQPGNVQAQIAPGGTAWVSARTVELKSGTGFFATSRGILSFGDQVTILQVSANWAEVRSGTSSPLTGWMPVDNLSVTSISAGSTGSSAKNKDNDYQDTGMLFHAQNIPDGILEVDYRLIIDGLWTVDPLNPLCVTGSGGLLQSRVIMPVRTPPTATTFDAATGLRISYKSSPGELITVAGSFNGWDPFMYVMKETSPGLYTFTLALPPGTYHYVFFKRGERLLDPQNPFTAYTKDGKVASEAIIR